MMQPMKLDPESESILSRMRRDNAGRAMTRKERPRKYDDDEGYPDAAAGYDNQGRPNWWTFSGMYDRTEPGDDDGVL